MNSLLRRLTLLALVAAPAALSACAMSTSPVTGRKRAYAYTWQQEIALGRQADEEIVEQFGTYHDPKLQKYVERVGRAVLERSHLRRENALPEYRETEFTFRVLDSEIVNAFAVPGGYVYVTRGLLAHLENEAQLAVVLGHEVAHVAARHGAQDAFETGLVTIGLLGASLLGEELAGIGEEVMQVGGLGMQLMMFRYSRDDERESDRLGVEYAAMAGYQAAEGADFFTALKRMQQREGWFPGFLSTHPDPGRREETVRQLAAEWAGRGHDGDRVEREGFLAQIEGMAVGRDPRQGFEEDGVFYHPAGAFSFSIPRGWAVRMEGRQMQIVPDPDGDGDGAEFGVVFSPSVRESTASLAAAQFVAENELGTHPERTTVNGFAAARVEALAQSEDDGDVKVVAYFVQQGDGVRHFMGIAGTEHAYQMEAALERMIRSFRRLTDPEILEIQPSRLSLVTTPRAAPFRSLVDEEQLPRGMDLDDLAILNGVGPDEMIPAGTTLKLPR